MRPYFLTLPAGPLTAMVLPVVDGAQMAAQLEADMGRAGMGTNQCDIVWDSAEGSLEGSRRGSVGASVGESESGPSAYPTGAKSASDEPLTANSLSPGVPADFVERANPDIRLDEITYDTSAENVGLFLKREMEKPKFSYIDEKTNKKVNLNYLTSRRKFKTPKVTINETHRHISINKNTFYYADYQRDTKVFSQRLAVLNDQLII